MEPLWADSLGAVSWLAPWAWAVLLLVLGVVLVVLEIFIPSGGVLGFLAACAVIAAVAVGFMDGRPWVAMTILFSAVFGLPLAVITALRVWPSTPMGRRMLLGPPADDEDLPDPSWQQELKRLVDRVGVAKTKMLPSGAVTIDGRTIDAVSEGMPIDPGQPVRVVRVHGNRVVVRPVEEGPSEPGEADPLSRPIDSVGLDPFEDPLA